jgi:hypothetical protein
MRFFRVSSMPFPTSALGVCGDNDRAVNIFLVGVTRLMDGLEAIIGIGRLYSRLGMTLHWPIHHSARRFEIGALSRRHF